ncbi:MAG TPA: CBS domain-containing protein, partial [Bdellovibrionota bacterium]|nr:CBS domain-containing protein [Bdellovibrionota bacterium]
SPKVEFLMAMAGPIVSVILGGLFFLLEGIGRQQGLPIPILGTLHYLGIVNLAIVIFNLVPGFPLDGGRILRAIIWHFTKSVQKATKITSTIGTGFGFILIALGILSFFQGAVIAGIWYALIGIFLSRAASMSYRRLFVELSLHRLKVFEIMTKNPITISPDMRLTEFVRQYCLRYHHHGFPVVEDNQLVGFIMLEDVTHIPQDEWDNRTVEEVMRTDRAHFGIHPNATADKALQQMTMCQIGRLVVYEGDQLLGLITIQDLSDYLQIESEIQPSPSDKE